MIRETIDEVGKSTLENLSVAEQLNRWMFDSIRPFVKGRILETGSGIGNISSLFVANGIPLSVSDYSAYYFEQLNKRFGGDRLVEGIFQLDLADEHFHRQYAHLLGRYDTVYSLNVIEHIDDHRLAVANCKKLLAPGGHLIVLVPAYQFLYNRLDKELEHFRRYDRRSIIDLFQEQGLEVLRTWYFNLAGVLGWFVSGTVMHKKSLPAGQLKLYNRLVPIFRLLDRLTLNQLGLSVVIVGRKPALS